VVRRLTTASCDNNVRVWRRADNGWVEEERAGPAHSGEYRGQRDVCVVDAFICEADSWDYSEICIFVDE
jgi:hypothetical protein